MQCLKCNHVSPFDKVKDFIKHLKTVHGQLTFICVFNCSQMFQNAVTFERHIKTHIRNIESSTSYVDSENIEIEYENAIDDHENRIISKQNVPFHESEKLFSKKVTKVLVSLNSHNNFARQDVQVVKDEMKKLTSYFSVVLQDFTKFLPDAKKATFKPF